MTTQIADMLLGAWLLYCLIGGLFIGVTICYDPPNKRLWLIPLVALAWPYYFWYAIAAYHGRG